MSLQHMLRKVRRRLRLSPPRQDDVEAYLAGGRRPWSRGYEAYRNACVARAIRDEAVMGAMRSKGRLPAGYGEFLDERVVEYPWVFSTMRPDAAMLLDAGSILNAAHLIDHPRLQNKKLHIVTLAPEDVCFWRLGVSYLFADLRRLPFADGTFDQVLCISTLEHVGKDNSIYTTDGAFRESRNADFEVAVRELGRVCKPGGQLLLSVPFGRFTDFGWYQQFDAALLDRVIAAFAPAKVDETFFRYADGGWQVSDRDSCADCEGFNIHDTKHFNPRSSRDYDPDFAAASRGIAALVLTKGA